MTVRQRFERYAKRRQLPLTRAQEVTRDGPLYYYSYQSTNEAWLAWQASRRAYT